MTAAATQRIIDRLQPLPDNTEPVIMNFISTIEQNEPSQDEARRRRADAFLRSFMDVEIDEQAVNSFRDRSMI